MNTIINPPPGIYQLTVNCCKCGRELTLPTEADMSDPRTAEMTQRFMRLVACQQCYGEATSRSEHHKMLNRATAWNEICPIGFRDTQAHMLPSPTKLQRTLNWQYGPKGLMLYGESRMGKSRCAWKLCEREYIKHGRDLQAIDYKFGHIYAAKISVSGGACYQWLDELMQAPILLADDVFKIKLTEAAETALFAMITDRTENRRPIIMTVNGTSETLSDRISSERREPMIQRLKEFCEPICFGEPKPSETSEFDE